MRLSQTSTSLNEGRAMDSEFQPGSTVWAKGATQRISFRIAAIFSAEHSDFIFGLLWNSNEQPCEPLEIYRHDDFKGGLLGNICPTSEVSKKFRSLGDFFTIVRFVKEVSNYLRKSTGVAVISEDITKNALGDNKMSVRIPWRRNSSSRRVGVGHNNTKHVGRRGYLIGDVTNARLNRAAGDRIVVEHAGLAMGKGGRVLTEHGDGGLPLISKSNALVGFVVGKGDKCTLILPAENLAIEHNIKFRTFPNTGAQRTIGSLRMHKSAVSEAGK